MAKTYEFIINLREAEIDGPFVSVVYGGSKSLYRSEVFTGTLAEAVARRDELSGYESRSHQASIIMANRNDRKPPGLNALRFPAHPAKDAPL